MTGPDPSDADVERRLRALKGEVIEEPRPTGDGRRRAAGRPTDRPREAKPGGAGVRAVGWSLGQARAGRLGLWIGVGLTAIGAYLVLEQFVPAVRMIGSLGLALAGGVLLAWVVTGRAGTWALNIGAILAGYGGFRFAAEILGLRTGGWGTLGAGLCLLALAGLRMRRGKGLGWQVWVGGFWVAWGGWGVLGSVIPGFPSLGDLLVPGLVVVIGVVLLRRGLAPGR